MTKRSPFGALRDLLRGARYQPVRPAASDRLRLSGKSLGVPCSGDAYAIEMGRQVLHVCPELPLAGGAAGGSGCAGAGGSTGSSSIRPARR